MNIGGSISSALSTVANFVPRLVLFAVILVVGWLIARGIRTLLAKLLARVGFDRVAERGGLTRWLGRNTASGLTARLVFYAIMLFTLQLGFGVFGPNPVSRMIDGVVNFLPKAFVAIVLVVIAAAIARVVRDLVTSTLGSLSYGNALGRIAQVCVIAIGVIAALNQIGVAMTVTMPILIAGLAAVAGVVIVGVGGGLVMPMRERWERVLNRAEREAGSVRDSVRSRSSQHDMQADSTAGAGGGTGGYGSGYSYPQRAATPQGGSTGSADATGTGEHGIPPAYGGGGTGGPGDRPNA